MDKEKIKSSFVGCMLGIAVGDTLGSATEFLTAEQIESKFGQVRDYQDTGYGKGVWTDDTQMALDIAESYVENKDCALDDIAARFVKWFEGGGRGIGFTTSKVLYLISQGMVAKEASELVWEESKRELAGNGALMRCAPIALARLNNHRKLLFETREISLITHFDPRSAEACVFFNSILADEINGEIKDIDIYLVEVADERVVQRVRETLETDIRSLPVGGYVLDTLGVALWIYRHINNFEEAVITAVNLGGDTDSNAAVVGALFGGKYGVEAIPERWLKNLLDRDRIEKAALDLWDIFY